MVDQLDHAYNLWASLACECKPPSPHRAYVIHKAPLGDRQTRLILPEKSEQERNTMFETNKREGNTFIAYVYVPRIVQPSQIRRDGHTVAMHHQDRSQTLHQDLKITDVAETVTLALPTTLGWRW